MSRSDELDIIKSDHTSDNILDHTQKKSDLQRRTPPGIAKSNSQQMVQHLMRRQLTNNELRIRKQNSVDQQEIDDYVFNQQPFEDNVDQMIKLKNKID